MAAEVIAVCNQKGESGKSTVAMPLGSLSGNTIGIP